MPKKEMKFKAGDILFKKGDICDGVFTVVQGTAEQFYEVQGNARPLREEKKGAVLGKKGVLEGVYDISVRAKTDITVEWTDKESYIVELQHEGELTPSQKEKPSFDTGADDTTDFNFDFGLDDDDKKPERAAGRERPGAKRRGSTALQKIDDFNDDFSFSDQDEEPKKNELVKVGRQAPAAVAGNKGEHTPVVLQVNEKVSPLKEWLTEGQEPEVAYGTCFLLTSIDGDDGAYRDAVYRVLRTIPDARVKVIDKFVTEQNPFRAVLQMRAWMKRFDADAGVYARLDPAGRVLEFHTVRAGGPDDNDSRPEKQGNGSRFFLPVDMNTPQQALLKAFAVSSLAPTRLEHEQLQRLFLPTVLNEARSAGATPIVGLNAEEQAVDLCCFADALSLSALYTPNAEWRAEAMAIYEHALSLMPPHAPEYIFLSRQLGLMRQIAGEKNRDVSLLRQAEKTFGTAVKTLSSKRQPTEWGDLKIRIGNVRQQIAMDTGSDDDFNNAIESYREALGVLTPQRDTEKWADALNGLARTVQLFGTFETKNVLLERAMKIYEKELALLDKEKFPLQWARASNNMASVLFMLFNRSNDTELLKRAVAVFSDALAVYNQQSASKMASITQGNLKRAEKFLAEAQVTAPEKKAWLDDLTSDGDDLAPTPTVAEPTSADDDFHFEKITLPDDLTDGDEG